jgi:adenine C2-methylase RlmN of 23S rRNA A2503 and tRNA A37
MQIMDQVSHPRVRYFAKNFDEQAGHRFTILVAADKPIETGVYLHWLRGSPVDVAVDISCMSGCTRKCIFCAAARTRGDALDAEQISRQVELAIERARPSLMFFDDIKNKGKITFSFQGIGEPADPTAVSEVTTAIGKIRHEYKDWNAAQFSISSILDRTKPLWEWAPLKLQTLQFSLHAPSDSKRSELLGGSIKTPIAKIFEALDEFSRQSPETQIKINYVLISNKNDTVDDCEQLLELLRQRSAFYLKISYLNETWPGSVRGLSVSQRHKEFLRECQRHHQNTYCYGAFKQLQMSCGQLATYAQPERADDSVKHHIAALYDDIRSGHCTLFLGAGASYTAWDARGLANRLYEELGKSAFSLPANLSLAEVADAFEHAGRRHEVDERIRSVLREAKVPSAMFDLPRYSWRAIYTTNYDEFVERAYLEAKAAGFAERLCHPVLHPDDLQGLASGAVPLIKLHGSVSQGLRTVLSETDYLDGYVESIQLFLHRLTADRFEGSVLFVGYSFRDHLIKQWLFDLKRRLSRQNARLWAVQGVSETTDYDRQRLIEQFGATLIATDFAGLMRELEVLRRRPVLMACGSTKRLVRGGAGIQRKGATDKIDTFCSILAAGIDERGVRLVTGATATDKVGYLIGRRMANRQLVTTYTWRGAEYEPGNELLRMIGTREVGGRPTGVIERLLREANVLLLVGGGALTLRETFAAMSKGIPVIPVSIGGQFASDVVHTLFSRQYDAVEVLAADSGIDARFSEIVVKVLSPERLEALQLDKFSPNDVAATVLEILDHVAAVGSKIFVTEEMQRYRRDVI